MRPRLLQPLLTSILRPEWGLSDEIAALMCADIISNFQSITSLEYSGCLHLTTGSPRDRNLSVLLSPILHAVCGAPFETHVWGDGLRTYYSSLNHGGTVGLRVLFSPEERGFTAPDRCELHFFLHSQHFETAEWLEKTAAMHEDASALAQTVLAG